MKTRTAPGSCRLIPFVLAAPWLAGCIIVPIPHRDGPVVTSRRVVEPAETAFIRPGATTRADVLLHLGEPDESWDDDRILAYAWNTSNVTLHFAVFAGMAGGGGGANEITVDHYLLFEFGDDGAVKRFGRKDGTWYQRVTDLPGGW
jgi:hypothetical protein